MSVRMGKDAWAFAKSHVGKAEYHNMCKAFTRESFNVDPSRSGTAKEAWAEVPASAKHLTSDPEKVPAYVWAFMDTSATAEHAVITGPLNAAGKRLCISVDAGPNHTIAVVELGKLADAWGPVKGWGELLDGQRIWTPAISRIPGSAVAPKPTTPAARPTPEVAGKFDQMLSLANEVIHLTTDGTPNSQAAYKIRKVIHDLNEQQ